MKQFQNMKNLVRESRAEINRVRAEKNLLPLSPNWVSMKTDKRTHGTISSIENGRCTIPNNYIYKLAKSLKIDKELIILAKVKDFEEKVRIEAFDA